MSDLRRGCTNGAQRQSPRPGTSCNFRPPTSEDDSRTCIKQYITIDKGGNIHVVGWSGAIVTLHSANSHAQRRLFKQAGTTEITQYYWAS